MAYRSVSAYLGAILVCTGVAILFIGKFSLKNLGICSAANSFILFNSYPAFSAAFSVVLQYASLSLIVVPLAAAVVVFLTGGMLGYNGVAFVGGASLFLSSLVALAVVLVFEPVKQYSLIQSFLN
jgi:hypothetical protein